MKKLTIPFFLTYFVYYAGYTVFSSYIVYYLTGLGYSATFCGIVTSLSLAANFMLQPVGGYLTDTYVSVKRYLMFSAGIVIVLCILCTILVRRPMLCMALLILTAGIAYPFAQLLDAWTTGSMEFDSQLVYSWVRAGGTAGFGIMSAAAGVYFKKFGWDSFFLIQAGLFICLFPLMHYLPDTVSGNSTMRPCPADEPGTGPTGPGSGKRRLNLVEAFASLTGRHSYLLLLTSCTLYWFGHRPVGSYLSIIVEECGGNSATYGMVCAVGAAAEYITLILVARLLTSCSISLRTRLAAACAIEVFRPLLLFLFPLKPVLYAAQILQSFSFGFFYSANVEGFKKTAVPELFNFSVSFGLMFSSVFGTMLANLTGGILCDHFGTRSLMILCIAASLVNFSIVRMRHDLISADS